VADHPHPARSGAARSGKGGDAARGRARELPAMRLRVQSVEDVALAPALASLPPAAPEDLAALARDPAPFAPRAALEIAARIPPEARARALELLWPLVSEVPESVVASLVPALRWIALTSEPGSDPDAWRAWLRARAER